MGKIDEKHEDFQKKMKEQEDFRRITANMTPAQIEQYIIFLKLKAKSDGKH